VVGEQHPDLVAGEGAPSVAVGHRHRQPVGVGVVGDHQVGVDPACQLQGGVERAGLLGVGEGHRREPTVGRGLARDHVHVPVAAVGERTVHELPADAVERGVDDREVRAVDGGPRRTQIRQVGVDHARIDRRDEFAVPRVDPRDLSGRPDRGYRGGDLLVDRRDDLGGRLAVHLVAVVLRGVVAGGDHHRGGGLETLLSVGHQRGRLGAREPANRDPGPGEHRHDVLGEAPGVGASVETDHHTTPRGAGIGRRQVVGQPPGGADDHRPVHPQGTGADHRPQPGGAEGQLPVDTIGHRLAVPGLQEPLELGARRRVGVACDPVACPSDEVVSAHWTDARSHRAAAADPPRSAA